MLELKYFDKIERYKEAERKGELEYPPFDIHDLGIDSHLRRATRWLQRHAFVFVGWFLRTLWPWPTFRFGRVVIVSRYDDVLAVLRNSDDFKVPFGREMIAVTDGANFVLGLDGAAHDAQRKLMSRAVRRDADLARILKSTRYFTRTLLEGSGGQIDVMRDLLGRVFTETADEYFGLDLDEPNAFLDRSFAISNVIFADPFGSPLARQAAISGSLRFRYLIDQAIDRAVRDPKDAYIDRLVELKVAAEGKLTDQAKAEIRAIVIGTLTGLIPTNTLGAGKILEELLRHPRFFARAKEVARAYENAPDAASRQQNRQLLKDILFEAARLNPALFPGQWRHAPNPAVIGGTPVPADSIVMVATMSALRDKQIFAAPGAFWPDRGNLDKAWLMFGAASHECFGSWLALEQFTEIFGILLSQPDIEPSKQEVGWLSYIGPFPRRLDMLFTTTVAPRTQEMITIQARLRPEVDLRQFQQEISDLGNPAPHDKGLGKALRESNLVHFASLTAFDARDPDAQDEPPDPRLVFELSADGDGEQVLQLIAEKAGSELEPIFAKTLGGERPLLEILRSQRVRLSYSPWETTGLNFNGTPDCPVSDIEMQAALAEEAKAAVIDYVGAEGTPGTRPITVLKRVRDTLRSKGLGNRLIRPARRRLAVTEWTGTGTTVGFRALMSSRLALYVQVLVAMLLLGQGALIYHFIVDTPGYSRWIAGAAFAAVFLMLTGLSLSEAKFIILVRCWAWTKLLYAHIFVAIVAVTSIAVVAALAGADIWLLDSLLAGIAPDWPLAIWAVATVGGLALLRLEYLLAVALLDRGRAAFGAIRTAALVGLVLAVPAGAWWAATHWPQTQANLANIVQRLHWQNVPALLEKAWAAEIAILSQLTETLCWMLYAGAGAVASVALGLGLIVGVFLLVLRYHEANDPVDDRPAKLDSIRGIGERENAPGYATNHILAVTPMKPGMFRKLTLAVALLGIGKLVQYWYRPGFVLNMGTIHYARWFRLPGSNALVFFSNYDGSWESYLEDFITKAHKGQSAAWSNAKGFPATRYLIFDGAQDGSRFKRWVRRQQRPTPFWFSRFPDLTTEQIRVNALIHDGLMRAATDTAAEAWLGCFGSMPRPDSAIEMQEVQSLVFRGFPTYKYSAMAAITLPPGREARNAHGWLAMLEYNVWFGETRISQYGPPTFVAFSAAGLDKLLHGGKLDLLASFPPAFRIGMGNRARILRDSGESAPENWRWSDVGHKQQCPAVDALVTVYGKTPEDCAREIETHRAKLSQIFGPPGETWFWHVVETQPTERTVRAGFDTSGQPKAVYEHFGFRDGMSQPIIRGTQKSMRDVAPADLVEPGEIILGYKTNAGHVPPPLTVPAEIDSRNDLPMEVPDFGSRFPRFGAAHTAGLRDFGRNGTFIAVRQFEQHVDRFDAFLREWEGKLTGDRRPGRQARLETLVGCPIDKEWIASKLMGRTRDGQPLLGRATRRNDNDFNFGIDDPQGLHCPFGAHIRRANPRGGMQPDDPVEIEITKRHRILRRGRTYEQPSPAEPGKTEKGTLFIALCADIERQFEFLQQSWVSSPSFQGLDNEPDPITATGSGGVYTIPTTAGPIRLKKEKSFVTVRGGGYFFMPSRAALGLLVSRTYTWQRTAPPSAHDLPAERPAGHALLDQGADRVHGHAHDGDGE